MFAQANIRNPSTAPSVIKGYGIGIGYRGPCECAECANQYRTISAQKNLTLAYEKSITNEEATAICGKLIGRIIKDRLYVQQQLALHGMSITKRWKKRTLKNRETLLKPVDPNLYERKWHEQWISYESRYGNWWEESRKEKYSNIYLLPYLSVENLKENPSR